MAVTRPRIQLWILESDASVAETVVELLTENENKTSPLVEVVRKSDPDLRQNLKRLKPAQSSDPKKYSEMGYKLLQRRLFEDVTITPTKCACFSYNLWAWLKEKRQTFVFGKQRTNRGKRFPKRT